MTGNSAVATANRSGRIKDIIMITAGGWAQAQRIPHTAYRDLSEREEVLRLVAGIIARTNEKLARVEIIRKFRMMAKAVGHEDGDLTATQKVKCSALTGYSGQKSLGHAFFPGLVPTPRQCSAANLAGVLSAWSWIWPFGCPWQVWCQRS